MPTKYFSANDLFSNCLNLAKLFAVNTNPIAPNCPINPRINIISRSKIPIQETILAPSFSIYSLTLLVSLACSIVSGIILNINDTKIAAGFQHIRIAIAIAIHLFTFKSFTIQSHLK